MRIISFLFDTVATLLLLAGPVVAQERPVLPYRSSFEFFTRFCMSYQAGGELQDFYAELTNDPDWFELDAGWFQNQRIALDFGIILTGRATPDCVVVTQPLEGVVEFSQWFGYWPQAIDPTSQSLGDGRYRIQIGRNVYEVTARFDRELELAFLTSRLLN